MKMRKIAFVAILGIILSGCIYASTQIIAAQTMEKREIEMYRTSSLSGETKQLIFAKQNDVTYRLVNSLPSSTVTEVVYQRDEYQDEKGGIYVYDRQGRLLNYVASAGDYGENDGKEWTEQDCKNLAEKLLPQFVDNFQLYTYDPDEVQSGGDYVFWYTYTHNGVTDYAKVAFLKNGNISSVFVNYANVSGITGVQKQKAENLMEQYAQEASCTFDGVRYQTIDGTLCAMTTAVYEDETGVWAENVCFAVD